MATYTTASGTLYVIGQSGRTAWPAKDPGAHKPRPGSNYNPSLDWGPDVARGCGLFVDARLSRDDQRVRAAGAEWREVYEHLQALAPAQ